MKRLEQIYMLLALATLFNGVLLCAVSAKKHAITKKLKELEQKRLEIAREYEKLAQFIRDIEINLSKH